MTANILIAVVLASGIVAPTQGKIQLQEDQVEMISPKVVSIHTVDASSPETIVKGIIRPQMTPEEKAIAVWKYCWQHTYHWPAPYEHGRETFALDVVFDAVKQVNVYGYIYCFGIRSLAEALYQAAGLEARSAGIRGHSIPEVYYQGGWHYLDNDQRGFSRLPDGTIASIKDYRGRTLKLLFDPTGPSKPFFPSVQLPRMVYEQKMIFAGYLLNQSYHYYQHDKFRTTHSMNLTLRPGERFIRSWSNVGKWNLAPKLIEGDVKQIGYADPWGGPRDPYFELYPEAPRNDDGSPLTFANGLMIYRPDLGKGARDYKADIYQEENIDNSGPGFCPAKAGKVAYADFRVRLPYVIVGWPGDPEKQDDTTGAAVVSGRALRGSKADSVRIMVSADEGRSWQEVWKATKTGEVDFAVDVSNLVESKYSYIVRFELEAANNPQDVKLISFGIDTACQLNPMVLPAVRAGKNQMTVSFEPGPEVFEETIHFEPEVNPADRAYKVKDLTVEDGLYPALGPKAAGQKGYVIYELRAPAGKKVVWAKVGGAFRSAPGGDARELYRIYYGLGRPGGWKLLWEADPAPYLGHWCFETNQEIPISGSAERVFVKYELRRSPRKGSGGGKMIAARLTWGCQKEQNRTPRGGIKVAHAWKQDGKEQTLSRVVTRNGQAYTFEAPGGKVQNLSIALEYAERLPASKGPHPLMLKPPELDRRELRDVETVQAMFDAFRILDESPTAENAANLMWNSKHQLVRKVMPAALLAIGGEKARQELRRALDQQERARDCLLDLLTNEGPTSELADFLKSEDSQVRVQAARLLVIRGDSAATQPLRKALSGEDDRQAIAAEVAALLRLEGASAAGLAERYLRGCTRRGKVEIAAALAAVGETKGFELLESAIKHPDRYVRYHACRGLAATGAADAERALIRALKDRSRWVRQEATVGLAKCGGRRSIRPLESVAGSDPEAYLRTEANWALDQVKRRLGRASRAKE